VVYVLCKGHLLQGRVGDREPPPAHTSRVPRLLNASVAVAAADGPLAVPVPVDVYTEIEGASIGKACDGSSRSSSSK